MKLFLDDERNTPDTSWHRVYRAEEAMAFLDQHGMQLTHISLDHDLGQDLNGYHVMCHLEQLHHDGKINPDVIVTIHSANPTGAKKMALACEKMFGRPWNTYLTPRWV